MKAILALVAAWAGFIPAYATATLPVHYGLFGDIHLAVPASMVRRTIILISDRNGWDARAESLSQALSDDGALVFGVDLPEYLKHMLDLKDKCIIKVWIPLCIRSLQGTALAPISPMR